MELTRLRVVTSGRLRARLGGGDLSKPWSTVWKSYAPKKICFFIWLIWHDSLPTLLTLHKRGIVQSPNCSRCGVGVEETVLHCLRDCNLPRQMWKQLGFETPDFFQPGDFFTWHQVVQVGHQESLFFAGIWRAWCARNSMCLGGEQTALHKILRDVHFMAETIEIGFKIRNVSTRPSRWVTWHPLGDPRTVLNVDGSSHGLHREKYCKKV